MAKKKLIPTWVKVAVVAALFVPFSVKIDRDENEKIKKVSTRSIAAGVTYASGDGNKESDLSLTFPGFANPEKTATAFSLDGDTLAKGARRFSDKLASLAKKTAAGVGAFYQKFTEKEDVLVSEPEEPEEPDITVMPEGNIFEEELNAFAEELSRIFTEGLSKTEL